MEDKKILETDDKAAKFVTGLNGWVDRHGYFWGNDENQARYCGCTHIVCDNCGTIRLRNRYCLPCHEKKRIETFLALEKKEWDGKIPLYLDGSDNYFFDIESLKDYLDGNSQSIKETRLRLCKPVKIRTLDEDYFLDDLHEDAELPSEIVEAIDNLNTLISEAATLTWEPDKYAAIVEL